MQSLVRYLKHLKIYRLTSVACNYNAIKYKFTRKTVLRTIILTINIRTVKCFKTYTHRQILTIISF